MQGRRGLFVGVASLVFGLSRDAAAQAPPSTPMAPAAVPGPDADEGAAGPSQAPARPAPTGDAVPDQPPPSGAAMPPVQPAPVPPPQPETPQAVPVAAPAAVPAAPLLTPAAPVRADASTRTGLALPGPEQDGGETSAESPKARGAVSLELGVGAVAAARFPEARGRSAEEALDGVFSLGAFVGTERLALGLVVERLGLGKDHYASSAPAETLNASYLVDTLWVAGRLHLTPDRPSVFLGAALGPSLPRLRGAGTRASENVFSRPAEPFQCSDAGRVGAGLALAVGVEADVASAWSLLGEARATGHLLSAADDAHGTCGPGSGPAVGGALRVGLAYRFGP